VTLRLFLFPGIVAALGFGHNTPLRVIRVFHIARQGSGVEAPRETEIRERWRVLVTSPLVETRVIRIA